MLWGSWEKKTTSNEASNDGNAVGTTKSLSIRKSALGGKEK